MLANQYRILAQLNDNERGYIYKAEIVEKGLAGLYDELFTNLSHNGISAETCDETHEILTMYRALNNFKESLSKAEAKAYDFEKIKFEGFDGNNDDHYSVMRFLRNNGLYDEYEGKGFDSHTRSSLRKYRNMLSTYSSLMKENDYRMTPEIMRSIIEKAY